VSGDRGRRDWTYELALDLPLPMLAIDAAGNITFWNGSAERVLGRSREATIGRPVEEALGVESREAFRREMGRLGRGNAIQNLQVRCESESGEPLETWLWAAPLREETGGVKGGLLVLVDITEHKREETVLRESEERFRRLIQQAGDGFFLSDAEGRFVDVNDRACEMLGYERSELLSMSVGDITPDQGGADRYRKGFSQLEVGVPTTIEDVCRRKDGKTLPVELRAGLLELGDQKLGLSLMRDITERKRAEEALEKARDELELRVHERTAELSEANARLAELTARLEEENIYLQQEIKTEHNFEEIIGRSRPLGEVLTAVETVAPTDSTVVILGETGTGKELVARAIHSLSGRSGKPLVKVNCAALPAPLVESELFGHERGAFTGAISRRVGRFELADRGTILLDEIGDLPLELQGKLLRVLQEGEFERVGGQRTLKVDVRIIAAANKDLAEAVQEQRFRPDLYYRLNVFPIEIPPLRERKEDIPLLVEHFVTKYAGRTKKSIDRIPRGAIDSLMSYHWPGNVRELENIIERAVILTRGTTLEMRKRSPSPGIPPRGTRIPTLAELQQEHILSVLEITGWRVSGERGAAELLGLVPTTLESRMKKLGLKRPRSD